MKLIHFNAFILLMGIIWYFKILYYIRDLPALPISCAYDVESGSKQRARRSSAL